MDAEVAHRRALEGLRGQTVVGREAERADIGRHVGDAQRSRQVAEELEEPRPVGPFHDVPVLVRGEARGDEVLGGAGLVDGGDGAVARAGERPGALDDFVQHRLKVEARADAQARRAERGDAGAQRFVFGRRWRALGHAFLPAPAAWAGPMRADTWLVASK